MSHIKILNNNYIILFSIFFIILITCGHHSPIPQKSQQMLLVLTPSDSSFQGKLYRFQREVAKNRWKKVGESIPIVLGKNGLGWGIGLHKSGNDKFPQKMEGDRKSPAGVFTLKTAFGFAQKQDLKNLNFPYRQVTEMLECIDDSNSVYYNQLMIANNVDSVDWKSSEKMFRVKTGYALGVMVDQNSDPAVRGRGSCIFLHIWDGPMSPTHGCTAMSAVHMKLIVFWLEEDKNPVLVQLTTDLYYQLKISWDLPEVQTAY
jgi:L,D-peptidoglycan transpeptidase YkuD (ErfK/YbiS/YcfS/YnhG family)